MATITDRKSVNATLSTTTVDVARLTQPWDYIEVTNLNSSEILTVTDDGATDPTAGLEGATVVPPSQSKVLKARRLNPTGDLSGTVTCHEIRVLGNGNAYVVEGLPRFP